MLNAIENAHSDILNILAERREEYLLDDFDISLVQELINLHEPFKNGSKILSSENEPTLHLVLPFVKIFKQTCEMVPSDKAAMKQVKRTSNLIE